MLRGIIDVATPPAVSIASVNGVTGSDEVWFNKGDNRYYLGASKAINPPGSTLGSGAVLGVVGGTICASAVVRNWA